MEYISPYIHLILGHYGLLAKEEGNQGVFNFSVKK